MRKMETPAALPGAAGAGIERTSGDVLDTTTMAGLQSHRRLVERVHALGPRALAEMIAEVADQDEAAGRLIAAALARYARIDPAALLVVRGDRFPPAPLLLVG